MIWLAVVLRDHSGPIEADLAREYGIDLLDFYRGKISLRALSVRIRYLPRGSALWQVTGSDLAWADSTYLLASAVDALQGANWQRAGGKSQAPAPVKRPADQRASDRAAAVNAIKAERFLARQGKSARR